jgi:hypothetical protein
MDCSCERAAIPDDQPMVEKYRVRHQQQSLVSQILVPSISFSAFAFFFGFLSIKETGAVNGKHPNTTSAYSEGEALTSLSSMALEAIAG